jgi:uncharacterized protein (UPF0210 family)
MGKTMTRKLRVRYNPIRDEYKIEINNKMVLVTPWEVYVDGDIVAVGRQAKLLHDAVSRRDIATVFSLLQPLLYIASI